VWIAGGIALLAIGIVVWLLVGRSSSGPDAETRAETRAALEAAGCRLKIVKGVVNVSNHSDMSAPEDTSSRWNTNPPTSGPHWGIPVVYGAYETPVNQAQLVHNLEHGAVFIQYGAQVPSATVDQLMEFYADHRKGTVVAPLPALGRTIALGAWIVPSRLGGAKGDGALATCTRFDGSAFAAFLSAFQFEGPERFSPDSMLPGST
jgi:hypothetical protein